jgi:hypothetical protein
LRSISKPRVENFELIFTRINEKHTYADSLVNVNDLAIRYESLTISGNDYPEERIYRKGARGVHVTSLAAKFCHSSHNASGARSFDEFHDRENGIARYGALNVVRLAQISSRIERVFTHLKPGCRRRD